MPRPVRGRGRPTAVRSTGQRAAGPSTAPVVTPEAQARLPELLAISQDQDSAARFREMAAETPGGPLALIEALGGSRDGAAGQVLAAVAATAPDREQRKAARRALHRLRSVGVVVPMSVPVEAAPVTTPPTEPVRVARAHASPSDGVGSRILWLLLERPHGGMTMFSLAINDVVGLKDFLFEETTRRRFDRRLDEWIERTDLRAIEIPTEYGLSLLSEALALNAESQSPLPRDFVFRASLLGELPAPPTDALIHQHISRGQTFLMPTLLDESAGLLETELELGSWGFSYGEVQQYAREYRQAAESLLVLTTEPREARQERIVRTAVDTLMTPTMRRAYRRRLEETAYFFWQTGRERSARQAVAAAFAIGETGSLRSHPLLRAIVMRSIEMAIEVDRSGMPLPPGANRTARDPV